VTKHGRPPVEPVLVVWGPAAKKLRDIPVRRHGSGVVVLSGDRLQAWLLQRARDQLGADQIKAIWNEIDEHAVRRDERERTSRPMPRSLAEAVRATGTGLILAVACFLLAGQLLELAASVPLWLGVGVALLAGAEALRRRSRFSWEARAFQAGTFSLYLLTGATAMHVYLLT
jgi:hypothetical protein